MSTTANYLQGNMTKEEEEEEKLVKHYFIIMTKSKVILLKTKLKLKKIHFQGIKNVVKLTTTIM